MKNWVFALGALLLATSAHASDYTALCSVDSFNNGSNDAISFIAIALALVSFAIALAYMYSKLKEDERIGVWAKDEAQNLVITVLLFAGILGSFTASCSLSEAYAGGDPIQVSSDYIGTLLGSGGLDVLRTLTSNSINDQLGATYYLYWGFTPFYGSGAAEFGNLRSLSAHKEQIIDMYLPVVASLTAQKYLLLGIKWVAASALLPFAFVLRIFSPTRDIGNLLIAIFFSLYIVVPAAYAMSGKVFLSIISQPPVVITGTNPFYTYGLDGNASGDARNSIFYQIGAVLPQAIFLPNLVIIIAVTCTTSLWKALRSAAV